MNFKALSFRCACGLVPARLKQVGLTSQHQLAIHWHCPWCKREIYAVKDLADCWRECPAPGEEQEAAVAEGFLPPDEAFLHSLGVRLPPDEQS